MRDSAVIKDMQTNKILKATCDFSNIYKIFSQFQSVLGR